MAKQVGPKNVVGRDKLIEIIWKKLETRSLQFTAERRVGKTTVMTKMAAEPKAGYEVLFMDLEGIDSVSLSQRARFPAAFPSPAPPLSNLEKQATVSLVT